MAAAAAVPLCEVCLKSDVETVCERKFCDNPSSSIYEQYYFVCPDNKAHPPLPEGSKKKNNDFFLMEKEWKKKQALLAGQKKLAVAAPPAPPKSGVAPAVAVAVGPGANFLEEMKAMKQIMLDLLVQLKKNNEARSGSSPPRKRAAPAESAAEKAFYEAAAADMEEAEAATQAP